MPPHSNDQINPNDLLSPIKENRNLDRKIVKDNDAEFIIRLNIFRIILVFTKSRENFPMRSSEAFAGGNARVGSFVCSVRKETKGIQRPQISFAQATAKTTRAIRCNLIRPSLTSHANQMNEQVRRFQHQIFVSLLMPMSWPHIIIESD